MDESLRDAGRTPKGFCRAIRSALIPVPEGRGPIPGGGGRPSISIIQGAEAPVLVVETSVHAHAYTQLTSRTELVAHVDGMTVLQSAALRAGGDGQAVRQRTAAKTEVSFASVLRR